METKYFIDMHISISYINIQNNAPNSSKKYTKNILKNTKYSWEQIAMPCTYYTDFFYFSRFQWTAYIAKLFLTQQNFFQIFLQKNVTITIPIFYYNLYTA